MHHISLIIKGLHARLQGLQSASLQLMLCCCHPSAVTLHQTAQADVALLSHPPQRICVSMAFEDDG